MRVLVFALLASMCPAQSVWVVDALLGPGSDFSDVQPAADAAAPGDTILVRGGNYGTLTVAKPLHIIAGRGAVATIATPVHVSGIDGGQEFVIQGLGIFPSTGSDGGVFHVEDCVGSVWIEDCQFGLANIQGVTVHVEECDAVTMARCRGWGAFPGGTGLLAYASSLHLFECEIHGQVGQPFTSLVSPATNGGTGLHIVFSSVRAHDTLVTGGAGGPGNRGPFSLCGPAANGGPAILMLGTSSTWSHLGSTWVGGDFGAGCPDGLAGSDELVLSGSIVPMSGPVYRFRADRVRVPNQTHAYHFDGPIGDSVVLALSAAPAPLFVPIIESSLLLDPTTFLAIPVGALDASGSLTIPTTYSGLPTGVNVLTIYAQAFGIGASGARAGAGQVLTLL